ncbi:hypothetical protein MCAMS1_02276 [biofilm metagenome]
MTSSTIDPLFPQIPKILEPVYMREILQRSLFRNRRIHDKKIRIESCEIGEKRYKPGKSFSLSYNLRLRDMNSDAWYEQWLTAQLQPAGLGNSGFDKCIEKPTYSPVGIPSVSYISEVDMLLWSFPHDRKLTQLNSLLDTDKLKPYIKTNLTGLKLNPSESVESIQAQVIHYLPEQSCMIRYALIIADNTVNDKKARREAIVYGKNYSDDSGLKTFSVMSQLAEQTELCATPLFYDDTINTLWQFHVPGQPFEWNLLTTSDTPSLLRKIAICIAKFHRCEINTSQQFGYAEMEQDLNKSILLAAALDSALGLRVQEAVNQLLSKRDYYEWDDDNFHAPLHLDLKMGNLLIADAVYLIDMDCVCQGNPLVDTGSFIANLYLNGLRAGAAIAEIDSIVAAFINEYNAAMGGGLNINQLNWYIAAALIHEVLRRSLRQQSTERLKHIDAYLAISNHYSILCQEGKSYA